MSVCLILVVNQDQQDELPPRRSSTLVGVLQEVCDSQLVCRVLLTGSLVVVDVDPVQLEGRVAHVAPRRIDAMLVTDHLPKLPKRVATAHK